jgi:hypothetical protein
MYDVFFFGAPVDPIELLAKQTTSNMTTIRITNLVLLSQELCCGLQHTLIRYL